MDKSISMMLSCWFDAKNMVQCLWYKSKVESGAPTKVDIEASFILTKNPKIDGFTLKCIEFDGNYIVYLEKNDIMMVRQSSVLYNIIREQFPKWLVESKKGSNRPIEDLICSIKILFINSVWSPSIVQKAIVKRWMSMFPMNLDKVKQIVNTRNLERDIEFEEVKR